MKIIIGQHAGFCFGVKRAMEIASNITENSKGKKVYMLREIIHNPQEVKRLVKMGIKCVEEIEDIKPGEKVIISTHGISALEEKELMKKRVEIIDTTCPYVKKIHNIVKVLALENYQIIIIGDKDHYEIKGIKGYAGNNAFIVNSEKEIEKIKLERKLGIVSQTTQNVEIFKKLVNVILAKAIHNGVFEIKIFNTICDATQKRQEEIKTLAKEVDIVIIIGGKNSANTIRLYNLSKEINKETYHVESEKDLKKNWFKDKEKVGISAGASTPEYVIENVVKKINLFGEK